MRILIIGDGKMGRAVEALAAAAGDTVVDVLGADQNAGGAGIRARRGQADVAIEFTVPDEAARNALACVEAGIPVVVGTTGWYDERAVVEARVREANGTILIAPNFSLGVAIATDVMEMAARAFAAHEQFGVAMIETHHAAKKDAPSGTAKAMAETVREALGRDVPVSSVRVGAVPGTHTLIFDGPFEQIVITHEARDRRVFADGALRAAAWLVGKTGVFTMRDVIARPQG